MHIVDLELPRTGYGVLRSDGSYKVTWHYGSTVILSKMQLLVRFKGKPRYIIREVKDVHDH